MAMAKGVRYTICPECKNSAKFGREGCQRCGGEGNIVKPKKKLKPPPVLVRRRSSEDL